MTMTPTRPSSAHLVCYEELIVFLPYAPKSNVLRQKSRAGKFPPYTVPFDQRSPAYWAKRDIIEHFKKHWSIAWPDLYAAILAAWEPDLTPTKPTKKKKDWNDGHPRSA